MEKTIIKGTPLSFSIGNQNTVAETILKTTFISENGNREFLITIPRIRDEFYTLQTGAWCNFSYYDKIGFYFFSAEAGSQLIKDGLHLYSMIWKTELECVQRRDNFRLPYILEGQLMADSNAEEKAMYPFSTFNISAGGIGLKTHAELSVGDRPVIYMALEDQKPMIMEAEICWKKQLPERETMSKASYGLNLLHEDRIQKEYIAKFVFQKQIEQRKYRR